MAKEEKKNVNLIFSIIFLFIQERYWKQMKGVISDNNSKKQSFSNSPHGTQNSIKLCASNHNTLKITLKTAEGGNANANKGLQIKLLEIPLKFVYTYWSQ